jgi:hypothetical protein
LDIMLKRFVAIVLCGAFLTTACASAGGQRYAQPAQPSVVDRSVMADYVQKIPAGSRIRVERSDGGSFRGTLMKATDTEIVVQKNTRVAEPPLEIPLAQLSRVTLDSGSNGSVGKAVGIGIAAGVGSVLAFLAILAATFND